MISFHDVATIALLTLLEIMLSVDNALALALLARHLPKDEQKKALTYGLIGALLFRLAALSSITFLIRSNWLKFVGGGYLLYIAVRHFLKRGSHDDSAEGAGQKSKQVGFWGTVLLIEVTDIAFAIDSILTAVSLSDVLWIVFLGGFIGVVAMRFAAKTFIRLIEKYPNFEDTAFQLVFIIGLKVILEAFRIPGIDFHSPSTLAFWIFWGLMLGCFAWGFRGQAKRKSTNA
jgi:YkoY family integral membrane protein